MRIFKEMGRTGELGEYTDVATLVATDPPRLVVEQGIERLHALTSQWQHEREQLQAQGAKDAEKTYGWMLARVEDCLGALSKLPPDLSEPVYSTNAVSHLRDLLTLPDYIIQSNRIARPVSELLLTQRHLCAALTLELGEFS